MKSIIYEVQNLSLCVAGMCARTMLAVLDNNNNVGRPQATVKAGPHKGEERFNIVFPKGRKGWVAKPIYEKKSYQYVTKLTKAVLQQCEEGKGEMPARQQAPNIASEERPEKADVIAKHRSRFGK